MNQSVARIAPKESEHQGRWIQAHLGRTSPLLAMLSQSFGLFNRGQAKSSAVRPAQLQVRESLRLQRMVLETKRGYRRAGRLESQPTAAQGYHIGR